MSGSVGNIFGRKSSAERTEGAIERTDGVRGRIGRIRLFGPGLLGAREGGCGYERDAQKGREPDAREGPGESSERCAPYVSGGGSAWFFLLVIVLPFSLGAAVTARTAPLPS